MRSCMIFIFLSFLKWIYCYLFTIGIINLFRTYFSSLLSCLFLMLILYNSGSICFMYFFANSFMLSSFSFCALAYSLKNFYFVDLKLLRLLKVSPNFDFGKWFKSAKKLFYTSAFKGEKKFWAVRFLYKEIFRIFCSCPIIYYFWDGI